MVLHTISFDSSTIRLPSVCGSDCWHSIHHRPRLLYTNRPSFEEETQSFPKGDAILCECYLWGKGSLTCLCNTIHTDYTINCCRVNCLKMSFCVVSGWQKNERWRITHLIWIKCVPVYIKYSWNSLHRMIFKQMQGVTAQNWLWYKKIIQ